MMQYNNKFFGSLFLIALAAGLSGFLFGYDAGIISGALLFIRQTFSLTPTEVGLIVSSVPFGALIASIISGKVSDLCGRKITLLVTALLFVAGSLLSAFAISKEWLILGRILLGLAIGVGSCISPVYVSELAIEEKRGMLVNLFVTAVQVGVFSSFVISYLFSHTGLWRVMVGIGIIPALTLAGLCFRLPESPRWLILKNRTDEARHILTHIVGQQDSEKEITSIKEVLQQEKFKLNHLYQSGFFKVIAIGVAVSFFTQTIGVNAIVYFAPTIFKHTGFANPAIATFATMFIGLMLVITTIASLFFIDKVGRRLPLLLGTLGILFSLLIITLSFGFIKSPLGLGWMMFIGSTLFMFFHGLSIGPACFLIPSEVFPARIRGFGMGISVAFNWGANALIAFIIPIVIHYYNIATLFAGFFVITVIGLIIFYLIIPETSKISLEQIELNLIAGKRARDIGRPLKNVERSLL